MLGRRGKVALAVIVGTGATIGYVIMRKIPSKQAAAQKPAMPAQAVILWPAPYTAESAVDNNNFYTAILPYFHLDVNTASTLLNQLRGKLIDLHQIVTDNGNPTLGQFGDYLLSLGYKPT